MALADYYLKLNNMKHLLLILVLIAFACKKPKAEEQVTPTPVKPCYDISLTHGVNYHPIYSGYDCPKFMANGDYYEASTLKGTFTFHCDCVVVKNASVAANNFYFKIARLTADTLQVYTARFGVTLFYK